MAVHNELGVWGEEVAAAYLRDKGYAVLERDWHCGRLDIDIIAMDGATVVFVEVKTRRNAVYADAVSAVDHRKRRHLLQAADSYVKSRRLDNELRFDIITVVGEVGTMPEVNHLEGAFHPY